MKIFSKIRKNLYKSKPSIHAVAGLWLIIAGFSLFFVGFHNVDIAQNLMRLELVYNGLLEDGEKVWLSETNLNGRDISLPDTYRLGGKLLLAGLFITLIGGFEIMKGLMLYEKRLGNLK